MATELNNKSYTKRTDVAASIVGQLTRVFGALFLIGAVMFFMTFFSDDASRSSHDGTLIAGILCAGFGSLCIVLAEILFELVDTEDNTHLTSFEEAQVVNKINRD